MRNYQLQADCFPFNEFNTQLTINLLIFERIKLKEKFNISKQLIF
jgi:hypothetical protein